jgi:hypothetical protein
MYEDFEIFKRDALTCGAAYYLDKSLEPQKIEAAFKIYRNARKGTTLLDADENQIAFGVTIVGRLALKVKICTENGHEEYTWLPSDESFPSIDEIMKQNLRILDESTEEPGAILAANNWSLLANDAWLLGGLHAQTEFHFASPLSWKNLWDEEAQRMTVTAREAIGITMHGYQIQRPEPKLEAVAVCIDQQKAQAASLTSYRNRVESASSRLDLEAFFTTLPSTATQY